MHVLDGVNTLSFAGFGWESFAWVRCTGFADGGLPMGSIPGSARVMGDLMGRHFGWVVDFFLGGAGEGKRNSRARLPRRFRRRREFQTALLYVIYYILRSGSFAAAMRKAIANGDPDPRCPGQTRALFGLRQPVDLARIEDGEGAAAPRSATDSTEQWV